ncbi:mucin-19-like [Topomyia yanbarensis]|uniref:mucin-19-like n=1 Tax=Topomyia yanbarensis TaxID=2498891 RepID=UPI00273AC483|nr:mucin-19-like [Topomyia yanbarensis]
MVLRLTTTFVFTCLLFPKSEPAKPEETIKKIGSHVGDILNTSESGQALGSLTANVGDLLTAKDPAKAIGAIGSNIGDYVFNKSEPAEALGTITAIGSNIGDLLFHPTDPDKAKGAIGAIGSNIADYVFNKSQPAQAIKTIGAIGSAIGGLLFDGSKSGSATETNSQTAPTKDTNSEPAPTKDTNSKSGPAIPTNNEPITVPNSKPAPVIVPGNEPAPAISISNKAAPVSITNNEPAPVVVTSGEPAPAISINNKAAPVTITNNELAPVILPKGESAPAISINNEAAPITVTNNAPAPVIVTNGEPAPAISINNEPAPVAITNNKPAPVTITNGKRVPVTSTNKNPAVPIKSTVVPKSSIKEPPFPVNGPAPKTFKKLKPIESCKVAPRAASGIFLIQPERGFGEPFYVKCDHEHDVGGWTAIHNRFDGSVDFYRTWREYKTGFGFLNGEFWLGLDRIHQLTYGKPHELLIVVEEYNGHRAVAKYSRFAIASEKENYRLTKLGRYSGTAGDSLNYHRNVSFSTADRDNDLATVNCARLYKAAWWYCNCFDSQLNGQYEKGPVNSKASMHWFTLHQKNIALKASKMLIRNLL